MPSELNSTLDVAIIGAGISGLAAARLLANNGVTNFKVFDANDRVGGRTFVDEDGTDLGGAYIGPTQDRIMQIIDELGLKLKKIDMSGSTVQVLNGVSTRYTGTIPPVSVLGMVDLNNAMISLDALCMEIDLINPSKSKDASWLDLMTGEELLRKFVVTHDAQQMMRLAIRSILCVEACQVSGLFLVWYIAQSGGCQRIFETENGAQDSKVIGGAGRIAQLLAKKYTPKQTRRLVLNSPIRSINLVSSSHVLLCGENELQVAAKYVIFAIPPVQMLRLQYTPALEGNRFASLQRWPTGCIIKTVMYYSRRFWREDAQLNGTVIAAGCIVCVSFDDTDSEGKRPGIMGFVLAHESLKGQTREERQQEICEHYARSFGIQEFLTPVGYKEKNWQEEQWVGGCYVGSVGPGVLTSCKLAHQPPLRDSKGQKRVYIAGTESARVNIGYMDGAVEAGERAARNVLVQMQRLPADQYNTISRPTPSQQMPCSPVGYSWVERALPSVQVLRTFVVFSLLFATVYLLLHPGNLVTQSLESPVVSTLVSALVLGVLFSSWSRNNR